MRLKIAFYLIVLTCFPAMGLGQKSSPMNLEWLVREAVMIFGGKVISVKTGERYTSMRLYATEYTFLVTEQLYGVRGDTMRIRQYGGEADGRKSYPPGVPRFQEGEEVVVFMYPPSRVGMTSSVGKEQGKFMVQNSDSGTGPWVVNSIDNRGLFHRLKHPELLADQLWLEGPMMGRLPYDKFVETLRELVRTLKQ